MQYYFARLQKKWNISLRWKFFRRTHEKGSVDGRGGEIKSLVWKSVLSQKAVVADLQPFVQCAQDHCKSTEVLECHKEIASDWPELDEIRTFYQIQTLTMFWCTLPGQSEALFIIFQSHSFLVQSNWLFRRRTNSRSMYPRTNNLC